MNDHIYRIGNGALFLAILALAGGILYALVKILIAVLRGLSIVTGKAATVVGGDANLFVIIAGVVVVLYTTGWFVDEKLEDDE